MSEIDLLIEELEDVENNPIKPFVAIRIVWYLCKYKYHEYRIAELEAEKCVLEDQQREVKNILIDKNLHIDSLYEEGYKLQQRIAELEAAQRWIPVSERLPEPYEKVIALAKDCMNVDWVLPKELRQVGKGAFARLYNVTHWMPLPESPIVYGKDEPEAEE